MPCDTPMVVTGATGQRYDVPCGRCPPCKTRKVQGWVFRLQQEDKRSFSSHFVTLTYDTHSVPISENGFKTLKKSDLQNFFKRLRLLCPTTEVKYYAVGEYGDEHKRPHYHAIIFNVLDTTRFQKAWTLDGKQIGNVHVGQVTNASIAYTLKYIDKKGYERKFAADDRLKEFAVMSKKLGENYLTDSIKKYHNADLNRNYITLQDGHKIALPRYYRSKIYDNDTMREQTIHIITTIQQQQHEDEQQFYRQHPGSNEYDYSNHVHARKHERIERFTRRLQQRKRRAG